MHANLTINLLSRVHQAKRCYRRHLGAWLIVCGIYALGVLIACGMHWLLSGSAHQNLQAQSAQDALQARQQNEAVNVLRRELNDVNGRSSLAQRVGDRPDWSILLYTIGQSLGGEVALREVRIDPRLPASGTTDSGMLQIDGARVVIRGAARTQRDCSAFTLRMQNLGLFDQVQMLRSDRVAIGSDSGIGFELECRFDVSGNSK